MPVAEQHSVFCQTSRAKLISGGSPTRHTHSPWSDYMLVTVAPACSVLQQNQIWCKCSLSVQLPWKMLLLDD